MTPIIAVDALTKRFGAHQVLDNLSFSLDEGVVGLIGPNGAGKSTLLKILLGLVRPTTGSGKILGLDIVREGLDIRRRVGVLHEKPRFPARSTGREYLEFSASLRSIRDAPSEIQDAARTAGIADALDQKIGRYSAGMTQRLGLACAIMGAPRLVILDEPTANLDPKGRSETLAHIRALSRDRGIHVLFSTHLLSEVERVCDSVVLLDAGRLLATGSLEIVRGDIAKDQSLVLRVDRPAEFLEAWNVRYSNSRIVAEEDQSLRILSSADGAVVRHINEVARAGGFEIQELRRSRRSLEEFFLAATAASVEPGTGLEGPEAVRP